MKTIEKRAKVYAKLQGDISLSKIYNQCLGLANIYEDGYIMGAEEQMQLTLEAFDEWLHENSWITRDESNRKPLEELRNIIRNI